MMAPEEEIEESKARTDDSPNRIKQETDMKRERSKELRGELA